MRWWIKAAGSAFFIAVALSVVFLWVRSHQTFDRVTIPLGQSRMVMLISYRGSVTITFVRVHVPEIWVESGRSHPIGTRTPDWIWPRHPVLGFSWAYQELMLNMPNAPSPEWDQLGITGRSWGCSGSGVMLPSWFIALILLTLAVLPWRRPNLSLRNLMIAMTLAVVFMAIFSLAGRALETEWKNGVLVTE